MYRVWIALAALLGFGLGSIVAFLFGIEQTGSPECDGPCFDKWDEVTYISLGVGVVTALAFGAVARAVLRGYFAKPS